MVSEQNVLGTIPYLHLTSYLQKISTQWLINWRGYKEILWGVSDVVFKFSLEALDTVFSYSNRWCRG